jgi:error-prone DNA polymerase
MVHPYLRRRQGIEPEEYPAPDPAFGAPDELKSVLGRTKGVPLFQEQAMKLAMVAAGFTPAELNELRRAMATFRRVGTIGRLERKMIDRMVERGYEKGFAERCFNQIKGFGEYGFPESHAASFAHLVYVSAWLKRRYPAAFAAALLNSQPMGFYAPAQIVRDAVEHGVEARPPDLNASEWDAILERDENGNGEPILRLGLRSVDGLSEAEGKAIAETRGSGPYRFLSDLQARAKASVAAIEKLAAADAFRSLGLDRRHALWQAKALASVRPLPLFDQAPAEESPAKLPDMLASEHVVNDYQTLRLSLKGHPMAFLRQDCLARGVTDNRALGGVSDGRSVAVAGLVLIRQRPGSAKGVVFVTLEDEFAVCNLVVWPPVLERFRSVVMGAKLMLVRGRVQKADGVLHVVAREIEDLTGWLVRLSEDLRPLRNPLAHADHVARPGHDHRDPAARHPRNVRVIPKSRDFH